MVAATQKTKRFYQLLIEPLMKDEKVLSIIDTTFEEETHSTRKIIAEEIGKSTAPTLATAN